MVSFDAIAKVDGFWEAIAVLSPTSTDAEFEKYASFVAPGAPIHLLGWGGPPSIGPEACIADIKKLLGYWGLVKRRVVSRSLSADGKTAVSEMDNHLKVFGEDLESFKELDVVEFNDEGLIVSYRLYADPTPIQAIAARKQAERAGAGQ